MDYRLEKSAGSFESYLLSKYGPTVGYAGFAEILGTTPGALRLRQSRKADLPPAIPGMARAVWPVPVIAAWLLKPSSISEPPPRRRGRPRNQRKGA